MTIYLQHVDWRVVLQALLGFYLLPSLLMNVVLASLTDEASVPPHLDVLPLRFSPSSIFFCLRWQPAILPLGSQGACRL